MDTKKLKWQEVSSLGAFIDYGVIGLYGELELDYEKKYTLSFIEEKLSNSKHLDVMFKYYDEIIRLFGKDIFTQHLGVISKNADYSYWYAHRVLEGRFELGEKAISEHAGYSYDYAFKVLKGRFELGENAISELVHSSKVYNEKFL